jgi:hypothetical protein
MRLWKYCTFLFRDLYYTESYTTWFGDTTYRTTMPIESGLKTKNQAEQCFYSTGIYLIVYQSYKLTVNLSMLQIEIKRQNPLLSATKLVLEAYSIFLVQYSRIEWYSWHLHQERMTASSLAQFQCHTASQIQLFQWLPHLTEATKLHASINVYLATKVIGGCTANPALTESKLFGPFWL